VLAEGGRARSAVLNCAANPSYVCSRDAMRFSLYVLQACSCTITVTRRSAVLKCAANPSGEVRGVTHDGEGHETIRTIEPVPPHALHLHSFSPPSRYDELPDCRVRGYMFSQNGTVWTGVQFKSFLVYDAIPWKGLTSSSDCPFSKGFFGNILCISIAAHHSRCALAGGRGVAIKGKTKQKQRVPGKLFEIRDDVQFEQHECSSLLSSRRQSSASLHLRGLGSCPGARLTKTLKFWSGRRNL
jgi:hypothetical protein